MVNAIRCDISVFYYQRIPYYAKFVNYFRVIQNQYMLF